MNGPLTRMACKISGVYCFFLYVYSLSLYTFLYYIIISERCRRLGLSPPRHWEFHVSAHIICHHSACCGQINWIPTCMGQQCILRRGAEILCCDREVLGLYVLAEEKIKICHERGGHTTQDFKNWRGPSEGGGITIRFGDRVQHKRNSYYFNAHNE